MRLFLAAAGLLALSIPGLALDPMPSSTTDMRFTKQDGTVATDPTQVYGPMPFMMGASGGLNTLYVSNWNDKAKGQVAFPTAITGHAELHSIGGTSFAGYFEVKGYVPGVVTTEIDAFNEARADAPAAYPWSRSFGIAYPLPIAITCGAGGKTYKAGACMEVVREGSTNGQFQHGIVFQKDAAVVSGITMDADANVGPKNNLVLRNTGRNGAVPILLQTTGPDNAAPSIQHQTQAGLTNWSIGNDGTGEFSNYLSVVHGSSPDVRWRNTGAPADQKNWSVWTDAKGNWSLRAMNDGYTVSATAFSIQRLGMKPTMVQFSVPVQLPILKISGLPVCNEKLLGAMAAVTDAMNPTYRGAPTGGGSVRVPVFCTGSQWETH